MSQNLTRPLQKHSCVTTNDAYTQSQ